MHLVSTCCSAFSQFITLSNNRNQMLSVICPSKICMEDCFYKNRASCKDFLSVVHSGNDMSSILNTLWKHFFLLLTEMYNHGHNILRLFEYFTKFSFYLKWNKTWLLVINMVYTSYPMSCHTTTDLGSYKIW